MVESLTNPTRTELLKRLVDDCEKQNPTIRVNVVSPPTAQADQKIQQMLQSGSGVDTVEVRDITVGPWSDNDWLHDVGPDLNGFISSLNIDRGSMSAAAVLTILPTMVLFAFASRHVVAGLTAGAVKG